MSPGAPTTLWLRTLMLLARQEADQWLSIADISETLRVSHDHLMKVVNNVARLSGG